MLQFKNIDINDIELYKKYADKSNELSCENSFINMLIWQKAYSNMMAQKDGQLIIKSSFEGEDVFRLPLGDDFEKGLALINEYCGDKKPCFWMQEGQSFERFMEIEGDGYSAEENREAFDYIYLRSDLAELPGKKYHSKRNHINAFSKKFDWQYKTVTAENIADVKSCADKWYSENRDRMDKYMRFEKNGVDIILNNMKKTEAKGGAIYADGKVVAFTLGSAINKDIFDIHIEKALADYSEAYTVINNQFAKNELGGYKYINREDDMGLEGLRKAKLSYKPYILLKKYTCRAVNSHE